MFLFIFRHDDDKIIEDGNDEMVVTDEMIEFLDEDAGNVIISQIIVNKNEAASSTNQCESDGNDVLPPADALPATDWSNYRPSMLRNKKNDLLKNKKASKKDPETSETHGLKKQILEQQMKHAQLEHDQRMMHSEEEHKLRIQILEAELKSKQSCDA